MKNICLGQRSPRDWLEISLNVGLLYLLAFGLHWAIANRPVQQQTDALGNSRSSCGVKGERKPAGSIRT